MKSFISSENWKPNTCCICEKEVESLYSVHQHLENGKTRIYEGHKGCLMSLETRLAKGVEVPYQEFDTPKSEKANVESEQENKGHKKPSKKPSNIGVHSAEN